MLNVRLKPSESSAQPRATYYTNVGVAQGIAQWILASSSLRASPPSRKPRRMIEPRKKGLDGTLVTSGPWVCERAGTALSVDPTGISRVARCDPTGP